MSAVIDVQLPPAHPWSGSYLPGLVGTTWWLGVVVDGMEQQRPCTIVGAVRLPMELGGVVLKIEVP